METNNTPDHNLHITEPNQAVDNNSERGDSTYAPAQKRSTDETYNPKG